jgi:rubrerythrin
MSSCAAAAAGAAAGTVEAETRHNKERIMELKGSRTEANLREAFAGESQARNKYTYFASVAKKEGYEQIAAVFLETAEQEKEHAKLHLKALGGIGDTAANLEAAAAGEHAETTEMYPRMAREAREEGFEDLARAFEGIGRIEKGHRERYLKLLENLQAARVFQRPEKVMWRCRNCGFTVEGAAAPQQCPVCKHPRGYFEIAAANY